MNDRRAFAERVRDLLRGRPARVLPLRPLRRDSGPRVRPDGWHTPEVQAVLGPACKDCGERMVKGSGILLNGRCGHCARRAGEWPPAA